MILLKVSNSTTLELYILPPCLGTKPHVLWSYVYYQLILKVDLVFDQHPVHLLLCLVFRVKDQLNIRHSVQHIRIIWQNNVVQYVWSELELIHVWPFWFFQEYTCFFFVFFLFTKEKHTDYGLWLLCCYVSSGIKDERVERAIIESNAKTALISISNNSSEPS